MLTVLIKHRATGRDVIHEAETVEFHDGNLGGVDGAGLILNHAGATSSHLGLSRTSDDLRDVFVMNSNGKTVARYEL